MFFVYVHIAVVKIELQLSIFNTHVDETCSCLLMATYNLNRPVKLMR